MVQASRHFIQNFLAPAIILCLILFGYFMVINLANILGEPKRPCTLLKVIPYEK